MRKKWLVVTVLVALVIFFDYHTAFAASDYQNLIPVDKLKDDNVSYLQRAFAEVVTAIPKALMAVLDIQDIDTLVFGKNDWVYSTFPNNIWEVITGFYNITDQLSGSLLLIAISVWGLIFLFRAYNSEGRSNFKEMNEGILIYLGGMFLASYFLELIFKINHFFVEFAQAGLASFNIPSDMKFLDLVSALQDTPTIGGALLFLVVVCSVGVLNWQYALRMFVLCYLIILFPAVTYFSIFPWSRRAIDSWMREFTSQVFENAGHAIAFAIFLAFLKAGASNWILFAFLFGIQHIAGLIRLVLGAPTAGKVGTPLGLGSMKSIMGITKALKGGSAGGLALAGLSAGMGGSTQPKSLSEGNSVGSTASPMRTLNGGMGLVGGFPQLNGRSLAKQALKMTAKGSAGAMGAMVGGALTGNLSGAVEGFGMGLQAFNKGTELVKKAANNNPLGGGSIPLMNDPSSKAQSESPQTSKTFFNVNEMPKNHSPKGSADPSLKTIGSRTVNGRSSSVVWSANDIPPKIPSKVTQAKPTFNNNYPNMDLKKVDQTEANQSSTVHWSVNSQLPKQNMPNSKSTDSNPKALENKLNKE